MASIEIAHAHRLGAVAARERLELLARRLSEKVAFDCAWEGNEARLQGPGASGVMRVTDGEVRVELTLNRVLRPMKRRIEGQIRDYLDEVLG